MPWDELMARWNEQPVLRSSKPRIKGEHNFCRAALASYLRYFSLGRQEYLTAKINSLDMPILWLAPKNEAGAIRGLKLKHPSSRMLFVEGGHRFVFDYPELTSAHITKFLRALQ
jgi:hypothetical protein